MTGFHSDGGEATPRCSRYSTEELGMDSFTHGPCWKKPLYTIPSLHLIPPLLGEYEAGAAVGHPHTVVQLHGIKR